jgi:hypothetical protein
VHCAQRWWGKAVERFGVGPPPCHITDFATSAVEFVDRALAPDSEWRAKAEALDWGNVHDDGVKSNVDALVRILEEGVAPVLTSAASVSTLPVDLEAETDERVPEDFGG